MIFKNNNGEADIFKTERFGASKGADKKLLNTMEIPELW